MLKKIICYFIILVSMAGCCKKPPPPFAYLPFDTILTPRQMDLLKICLNKTKGVQIIQQGAKLKIVLFTDYFFEPLTTYLEDDRELVLHEVSLYLHNYLLPFGHPYPLIVSGHADNVFPEQKRLRLSLKYATKIADYLNGMGFPPEHLSVRGYGAEEPIASLETSRGNHYNRRVMIEVF